MASIVEEKEIQQQEDKAKVKAEAINIPQFLKEVRTEFVKITWPSKEQVTREFFSVILLVSVLTGIIFLLDKIFEIIVNFFTGRVY